jgi:hypothetical protein
VCASAALWWRGRHFLSARSILPRSSLRDQLAQVNQSSWIITSVALTTAETVSPFFRLGRQHCGRDNALNDMVPDPNNHMSHDIAELNLFNLSAQFVSS